MAIDLKYGRVELEKGTIGEDEPVFVFRAQDRLLPYLLTMYEALCESAGSPAAHLTGIDAAREAIMEWQEDHHVQVPRSDPS